MRRLAVVLVLAVAGCSAGRSPAQVIFGAPAAAVARHSAKVEIESVVRISGQGQTFSSTTRADGVSQLGGSRLGHMTLNVTTNPSAGARLLPCEMVSEATLVYVKIPASRRGPDAKSWIKVDVAKVAGLDPSALSSDPTAQLDYLKSVTGAVKELGHDDIRGVRATHYQYPVNVDQFLAKLPAAGRQRMHSAFAELGVSTFPLDVWIDADGLPRRLAFEWKTTKAGGTFGLSTRIETYDYGTAVDVALPSAKDVRPTAQPSAAFAECFGVQADSLKGLPQ